jgi:hypothetical protein
MTFAAGTGIVVWYWYAWIVLLLALRFICIRCLSTKRTILVGNQVNATAVLSGFTPMLRLLTIEPGMGVTGTNIAANSVVLGVTPSDSALVPPSR